MRPHTAHPADDQMSLRLANASAVHLRMRRVFAGRLIGDLSIRSAAGHCLIFVETADRARLGLGRRLVILMVALLLLNMLLELLLTHRTIILMIMGQINVPGRPLRVIVLVAATGNSEKKTD
jgi:hypothetical protein